MSAYGQPHQRGLTGKELQQIQNHFEDKGCQCDWIFLNESLEGWLPAQKAVALVVRGGMKALGVTGARLSSELHSSEWPSTSAQRTSISKADRKLLVEAGEQPRVETKDGELPFVEKFGTTSSKLREAVQAALDLGNDHPLIGDAWRLHDVTDRCTIPFHEPQSKICVDVHTGHRLELHFRWRNRGKVVSDPLSVMLNHGDLYVVTDERVNLGISKGPKLEVALGALSSCWNNRLELQFGEKRVTGGVKYGPDSWYIPNFMQDYLGLQPDEIMNATGWNWIDRNDEDMKMRGHILPRTKCVLYLECVLMSLINLIARYWYSGWQWGSVLKYIPMSSVSVVAKIVTLLNERLLFRLNGDTPGVWRRAHFTQCIATRYDTGEDDIDFHNDKTEDITKETLIPILSSGEIRELHLCPNGDPTDVTVIRMEPGSMFVLGPLTNQVMKHGIAKAVNERELVRADDDSVARRISLVLRDIKSFTTPEEVQKRAEKTYEAREQKRRKTGAHSE